MRASSTAIRQLVSLATSGAPVKLRFRGSQAMTDGNVITLPEVSIPSIEDKMPGYAWHESFHIRYTNFSSIGQKKVAPLEHMLTNIIEDGRIERVARKEYPGTHWTLDRLIGSILETEDSTLFHAPRKGSSQPNILLGFVLNWTRAKINDYTSIKHLEQWRDAALSAFGRELVTKIESILDQTRSTESTCEAGKAAREIIEALGKAANSPEDQESDTDSQGSGDGEADQSGDGDSAPDETTDSKSGSGSGQGNPDDEEGGQGGGDGDSSSDETTDSKSGSGSGQNEPDDEAGQGQGDGSEDPDDDGKADGEASEGGDPEGGAASDGGPGSGDSQKPEQQDASDQSPQAAAKEALAAGEDDLDATDLGEISREAINRCTGDADDAGAGLGAGNGPGVAGVVVEPGGRSDCLNSETRGAASALGTRIRGILQGETLVRNAGNRRRGRKLDTRRLCRVMTDDPRIWRAKREQIDTCGNVHMILDTSGSMAHQVENLRRFGYATMKAIDSVEDVSVSVSTLPIDGEIKLLKLPLEHAECVGSRFDAIRTEGGTPLAPSIKAVHGLITTADVENRLLLIFTDGAPASPGEVQDTVEGLQQQGVACCGVILGEAHNCLEEMMPCERVDALSALPAAASRLVAEALRRKIALRRVS